MSDHANPTATRHVRDLYGGIDGLNAAAEAVEELVAMPGWEVVQGLLDAERATIDRKLDNGLEPMEQAQYALLHGRRGGLNAVYEQVHALLARRDLVNEQQREKHEQEEQA